MTTLQPASEDIIDVLRAQHARIESMFVELQTCPPRERQHLFNDLREFLAVHEAAEEIVLRPVSRRVVEGIADDRNAEEKEASTLLARLEDEGADSPGFTTGILELKDAVLRHARSEEALELPNLPADADERAKLGRRFLQAEALAPTHPHPSTTGSSAATAIVGPFASMLDRAKDALRQSDDVS